MGTVAEEIARRYQYEERCAQSIIWEHAEEDRYLGPAGIGCETRADVRERANRYREGATRRVKDWAQSLADHAGRDAARHASKGRTEMASEAEALRVKWQEAADAIEVQDDNA